MISIKTKTREFCMIILKIKYRTILKTQSLKKRLIKTECCTHLQKITNIIYVRSI